MHYGMNILDEHTHTRMRHATVGRMLIGEWPRVHGCSAWTVAVCRTHRSKQMHTHLHGSCCQWVPDHDSIACLLACARADPVGGTSCQLFPDSACEVDFTSKDLSTLLVTHAAWTATSSTIQAGVKVLRSHV